MTSVKKIFLLAGLALSLAATAALAADPAMREEMTRMEMKFVDLQIMAAADEIDFAAVRKALSEMEASAKKIRNANSRSALHDPLTGLTTQISGLKGDARRKDRAALKANMDRLFDACFKCHQSHAPAM